MNPITHLFIGWLSAEAAAPRLDKRSRMLISVAGIIPDLDGFGMPFELLTRDSAHELLWFSEYHHTLGHNLGFAMFCTALGAGFARSHRALTAVLVGLSFHLHLLGDLIGARGLDGEQWPIPYLLPFSDRWQWVWAHQWPLNGWPNILITLAALALIFRLAWKRGYSPLEMISLKLDAAFVQALHQRFGMPDAK